MKNVANHSRRIRDSRLHCICDYQFGANFEEMFPAVLSCTTPNDRTVTSGEFFILLIFCTAIIPLLISGWRDGSHAVHNGCTPFVDMSTKLSCVCGLCRCLLITMNQFETHEPLRKKARPQFVPLTRPEPEPNCSTVVGQKSRAMHQPDASVFSSLSDTPSQLANFFGRIHLSASSLLFTISTCSNAASQLAHSCSCTPNAARGSHTGLQIDFAIRDCCAHHKE